LFNITTHIKTKQMKCKIKLPRSCTIELLLALFKDPLRLACLCLCPCLDALNTIRRVNITTCINIPKSDIKTKKIRGKTITNWSNLSRFDVSKILGAIALPMPIAITIMALIFGMGALLGLEKLVSLAFPLPFTELGFLPLLALFLNLALLFVLTFNTSLEVLASSPCPSPLAQAFCAILGARLAYFAC